MKGVFPLKNKTAHLEELTYFNAICCLLVILIHVLSLGISTITRSSWQGAFLYLPWRMAAFTVPAFLFSGAAKVGAQLRTPERIPPYGRYISSRFQKIYLPFLLCNVVYYLVFMYINYVAGTFPDFFQYLITGTLSSPFYYVLIAMQFYLLFPLWRAMIAKIPFHCAFPSAVLITFFSTKSAPLFGALGVNFPYTDRIFTSYLAFWVLGLYVGFHYDSIRRHLTLRSSHLLLMAIPYVLYLLMSFLQYAGIFSPLDLDYCKLFTDCISIYVLLCLCRLLTCAPRGIRNLLDYIHSASFFVYLYHCLFLTVGTVFFQRLGIYRLSLLLLLRAAVCYTAPFILYFLWSKFSACLRR